MQQISCSPEPQLFHLVCLIAAWVQYWKTIWKKRKLRTKKRPNEVSYRSPPEKIGGIAGLRAETTQI